MFLNEATKLRAQTIIKGLEKRNMHGVFCATKEDALKQALSYIKEGFSAFAKSAMHKKPATTKPDDNAYWYERQENSTRPSDDSFFWA